MIDYKTNNKQTTNLILIKSTDIVILIISNFAWTIS